MNIIQEYRKTLRTGTREQESIKNMYKGTGKYLGQIHE